MDRTYLGRIEARSAIIRDHGDRVIGCQDGAEDAVFELYEYLVATYLPARYPSMFRLDNKAGQLHNLVNGAVLPLRTPADPREALQILGVNIDQDYLFMLPSNDGDGYTLKAMLWCYPVGFDPLDKFGRKLRDVHEGVPHYRERLESSMDRFMSRMTTGKMVVRANVGCLFSALLLVCAATKSKSPTVVHCNKRQPVRGRRVSPPPRPGSQARPGRLDTGPFPPQLPPILGCGHAGYADVRPRAQQTFVRSEKQKLFKLPKSGAVLFGIENYQYPIRDIKEEGSGPDLARAIEGLAKGNAPEMHRYKRWVMDALHVSLAHNWYANSWRAVRLSGAKRSSSTCRTTPRSKNASTTE